MRHSLYATARWRYEHTCQDTLLNRQKIHTPPFAPFSHLLCMLFTLAYRVESVSNNHSRWIWGIPCPLFWSTRKLCGRGDYIMTKRWSVKVCVWGGPLEALIQCARMPVSPCVCDPVHTQYSLWFSFLSYTALICLLWLGWFQEPVLMKGQFSNTITSVEMEPLCHGQDWMTKAEMLQLKATQAVNGHDTPEVNKCIACISPQE